MFAHVFNDLLNGNVYSVFDDALVQIADDTLYYSELLEQLASSIKYLVGEHIFFTVDP